MAQVNGIHLIWIVVTNLEEAIQYYTKVVGLKLMEHSKEYGWAELAGVDGSRLGIAEANKEMETKAGSNAVVSLTVDNLDEIKAEYKKKGVSLVGDTMEVPGHVKLQSFKDKDGNLFQLAEKLSAWEDGA